MRRLAALLALLVFVSCGSAPPVRTAAPLSDLVIPTTVPNGRVDVIDDAGRRTPVGATLQVR